MYDLLSHALVMAGGYFAIMNPIANTAVFTGLTASLSETETRKVARTAVVSAFFIVLVFIVVGKLVFEFFGITLPALRIAGGILVALIGFNMMHGKQSAAHSPAETVDDDNGDASSLGLSPLGIPILAGPGTIAVSMSYSASGGYTLMVINAVVFSCMCMVTYLSFLAGGRIEERLGANGLKVVTQLMGLLLTVVGVQMSMEGLGGAVELFIKQHGVS